MQLVSAVVIISFLRPPQFPSTLSAQIVEKVSLNKIPFFFFLCPLEPVASMKIEQNRATRHAVTARNRKFGASVATTLRCHGRGRQAYLTTSITSPDTVPLRNLQSELDVHKLRCSRRG